MPSAIARPPCRTQHVRPESCPPWPAGQDGPGRRRDQENDSAQPQAATGRGPRRLAGLFRHDRWAAVSRRTRVGGAATSPVRPAGRGVLDWATVRGFRQGDNPAQWRGHIDKLLPSSRKVRAIEHHPAIAWPDLPAFMGKLRRRDDQRSRALEFAILTAARSGEVIAARSRGQCSVAGCLKSRAMGA
jgi:integrase